MPFTEEARKLKQKRTTIKANLTRFCKYLDSCDSFSDSFELNVRLENANKWLEEFDLYQGKLEELSSVDDRDQDANELEREQFERSFYSAIAKAKSILNSITNSTTNQPIPQAFSVSSNPLANVKLPPLDLPQFDGDSTKWLQFHDAFETQQLKFIPGSKVLLFTLQLKGRSIAKCTVSSD
uniref:Uncharacterized protein n=1 Tax=Dendroctonus ponderosae TaxID=77166 RepID=A0AAR5QHU5_DENPD